MKRYVITCRSCGKQFDTDDKYEIFCEDCKPFQQALYLLKDIVCKVEMVRSTKPLLHEFIINELAIEKIVEFLNKETRDHGAK